MDKELFENKLPNKSDLMRFMKSLTKQKLRHTADLLTERRGSCAFPCL